jgi:hypothetical protein
MEYTDGAGAGGMVDVMQAERDAAGGSPVRPAGMGRRGGDAGGAGRLSCVARQPARQPGGQRQRDRLDELLHLREAVDSARRGRAAGGRRGLGAS